MLKRSLRSSFAHLHAACNRSFSPNPYWTTRIAGFKVATDARDYHRFLSFKLTVDWKSASKKCLVVHHACCMREVGTSMSIGSCGETPSRLTICGVEVIPRFFVSAGASSQAFPFTSATLTDGFHGMWLARRDSCVNGVWFFGDCEALPGYPSCALSFAATDELMGYRATSSPPACSGWQGHWALISNGRSIPPNRNMKRC